MSANLEIIHTYTTEEIYKIEDLPGIYTWYWSPSISERDLREVPDFNNPDSIISFLEEKIFSKLKISDYEAEISGPLLPKYEGSLKYRGFNLEDLRRKFSDLSFEERSQSLVEMNNFFKQNLVPWFSSPLYIGISNKVGRRIKQHSNLITKMQENFVEFEDVDFDELDDFDKSFATSVVKRGIDFSDLVVSVKYFNSNENNKIHRVKNILEFILNRIYYPICGKR